MYTVEKINEMNIIPGVKLGARIKDDCDRDIYGLEQSVDFIRGECASTIVFPGLWPLLSGKPNGI